MGDPNSARLLAKVLDRIDLILVEHGMLFKEDKDWEEFGGAVVALLYHYYEDETGGASDYEPGDSDEMTETSLTQSSETLEEDSVE